MTDDARQQIWAAVRDMYDGFLAGDRERIDRHILPEATIWDSEAPALAHGLAGLAAIRAARPTAGESPVVKSIDTYQPVIDVWGDVAVARYVFAVCFADPQRPTEVLRNTGVWRRVDGVWRVAHNHEDPLPAAVGEEYLATLQAGTSLQAGTV
jgi:ketosteroid isomerase-like protein